MSRRKPIVAVKSGRSAAGVRAASSHTAAMASPDIAVGTLFRQTGVVRVDTLDEMFDTAPARSLATARRAAGGHRRQLGRPGILAGRATASSLEIPELGADTQAALRAIVDPNGAVANPVDLVASATPRSTSRPCGSSWPTRPSAIIVICTHTFAAPPAAVAEVLPRAASGVTKPVVGCFLAAPELPP